MLNSYPSPEEELYAAAEHNKLDRLLSVLSRGVDINAKQKANGYTALIRAASSQHPDIVAELLKMPECDVNAVNSKNKSSLMFAAEKGRIPNFGIV